MQPVSRRLLCKFTAIPTTLPLARRDMPLPDLESASSIEAGNGLPIGNVCVIGLTFGASRLWIVMEPAVVLTVVPPQDA